MATEQKGPGNNMTAILEEFTEIYREETGEEPSSEDIEGARSFIIEKLSEKERVEHKEIYDELAKE